jgi:hypothetical protein
LFPFLHSEFCFFFFFFLKFYSLFGSWERVGK